MNLSVSGLRANHCHRLAFTDEGKVHHRPRLRGSEQRVRAGSGVHAQNATNLDGLLLLPGLAAAGNENSASLGSSLASLAHHPA